MKKYTLWGLLGFCGLALFADNQPAFLAARPVWPEGRATERNLSVGFRATFDGAKAENAVIRLTASSAYRLFINGVFLGYGPARGPKGFYRVDEWSLKGRCRQDENSVAIEVAGYNVNSYYLLDQPAFLQAEVVAEKRVLAATGDPLTPFDALPLTHRLQKVQRYSFQRPFSEVYRLTPESDAWRTGAVFFPAPLSILPDRALLPRIAPYPAFHGHNPARVESEGTVTYEASAPISSDRAIKNIGPKLGGYPEAELEAQPFYEVQRLKTVARSRVNTPYVVDSRLTLTNNQFRIIDFGENNSGFIGAILRADAPTRLYFVFDELLSDGDVSVTRMSCCNVLTYDLTKPGAYLVQSFEPYTLRYLKIIAASSNGVCEVSGLRLTEYVNPDAGRAMFLSSDPALDRIFEAARSTFKQNAVDVFTDCPSRERAGWLCDSFFIGRVAADLCGNTDMERLFLQNFTLPSSFEPLPQGMLPMCYPADHNDGGYIPNWALWFVIQLDEYLQRSGDRATVDALKPRVLALLDFFKTYKNSDGLLEKLPGWVFIEWSRANQLVQDVSYPSNMTYAEVLSCVARLYGLPEYETEAERVRETIRRQSYDGTFFVDNAKRQPDGTLKPTGERTETCQYYAFFFHTATPETYPALWKTLQADFGPDRHQTKKFPDVAFANAFIGNYLRLELLSRQGLSAQILDETKGYFLKMADLTGTLWENDTPTASCCHGFASHVERLLYRDVLGIRSIDPLNKKIQIVFADVPLRQCSGTQPVGTDALFVHWNRVDDTFYYRVRAPAGFNVSIDTSRLPLHAIQRP